jgi:poly(3-hydroxybutyrate) depolymerase
MIYQWYETQRALLSPFAEFASASSKLYNHPLSPFTHTPLSHRVSAGLDLMHRLSKEYEKPEFNIISVNVDGVEVAVQQQVAADKPFCRLWRFKRFTDNSAMLTRMKDQPGTPFDAAARNGARVAARPQGVHHRLDRRTHGA